MPTTKTAPPRRRKPTASVQEDIDTRALEIACRVEAAQEGHEDLCTERFRNLDMKIDDVKDDIRRGNAADQKAMEDLTRRTETYHQTNSIALKEITSGMAALALQFGVGQGKIDGSGSFLEKTLKVLPIIIATATLVLVLVRYGK